MSEGEHTVRGLWWVTEAPNSKVIGTLTYGASQGIRLELNADPLAASVKTLDEKEGRWCRQPSVILGQSENERQIFTIVDAVASSVSDRHLRFFANHILEGQHVDDAQTCTFTQISMEVDHLEAWAGGPLLADAIPQDDKAQFQPATLFEVDAGIARYEFQAQAFPFFRERESGKIYTCTVLARLSNPVTLREMGGELDKFLSLMTILIGARLKPRRLCVRQLPESDALEFIASWAPYPPVELNHHDMLMPLYNLGPEASAIFSKWFADWELLRQSAEMFLSACGMSYSAAKFLCLVSGVEAFHRATDSGISLSEEEFEHWRKKLVSDLPADLPAPLRQKIESSYEYANEYSLRQRLTVLLRDVLKVSTLEYSQRDRKSFVTFVVDARNRLVHGTRRRDARPDVTRASQDLTNVLLRLLLKRMGCSESSISSAALRLPWSPLAHGGISE